MRYTKFARYLGCSVLMPLGIMLYGIRYIYSLLASTKVDSVVDHANRIATVLYNSTARARECRL